MPITSMQAVKSSCKCFALQCACTSSGASLDQQTWYRSRHARGICSGRPRIDSCGTTSCWIVSSWRGPQCRRSQQGRWGHAGALRAPIGGHRSCGSVERLALRAGGPSKAIDQPEVICEPARLWRDHHSGAQSALQSCSMTRMTRCWAWF